MGMIAAVSLVAGAAVAGACEMPTDGFWNSKDPKVLHFRGAPRMRLPLDAAVVVYGRATGQRTLKLKGGTVIETTFETMETLKGKVPRTFTIYRFPAEFGGCDIGAKLRSGGLYMLFIRSYGTMRALGRFERSWKTLRGHSHNVFAADAIRGAAWLKRLEPLMSQRLRKRLSAGK